MTDILTKADIVKAKQNFDALNQFMIGGATEVVALPDGGTSPTRAGTIEEIKASFPEDSAAMRKIGTQAGRVPLAQDVYFSANNSIDGYVSQTAAQNFDCNNMDSGTRYLVSTISQNSPPSSFGDGFFFIETRRIYTSEISMQIAYGYSTASIWTRVKSLVSGESTWLPWRHVSTNRASYQTTTATSANVVVTSTGELQRSTSSKFFKKDIKDIDVADYRAALKAVRPISYKSTEDTADNTDWSWYSFIAEDLAKVDPRLVQFANVEFYHDTDEDGNQVTLTRELPEGKYAPQGINTNAIVALQTKIMQLLLADIEALEKDKTAMKTRLTKIEQRLTALEK